MKVKMLTAVAAPNWSAAAEEVIELTPGEAKAFIAAGYAVEVATKTPAENAAKNTQAPKGRGKEKR